ncbi:MAG: FtsX-like permease family protein [Bacteroidaceae bacterium]|nr:FtsX-like permease family protein [Bacteroidaceae bacterium]
MNASFYIARHYLLSKKSHHAINIISGVSVCGVAIATAALVCILSVFNGFQDMVADLFTSFDPELKVIPVQGKYMAADEEELEQLRKNEDIAVLTEVIEDNALLTVNNRQMMVTVKGVGDNFQQLTNIDDILVGDGTYELEADVIDYGICGLALLNQLGVTADCRAPFYLYAPRKGEGVDMTDPLENLNQEELFSPNVAFMVKQNKYDSSYIITSISLARRLFEKQGYVTAIELKFKDGVSISRAKADIEKVLGTKYKVLDRYEQQEDTFKIMKVEKLISYVFLTFILLIACFNIIGSLSMLIIDKKQDVITLRNLGASDRMIRGIFLFEGRMISVIGAVIGITLGVGLCLVQQYYKVVKFGSDEGTYIIDTYPVSVHATDIVLVLVTVIVIGFLAVWYPVRQMSRKYL